MRSLADVSTAYQPSSAKPNSEEAGFESEFWMGGVKASGLLEISDDPQSLDDGGFWAVLSTFEGTFTCAKFKEITSGDFEREDFAGISKEWVSTHTREEYISYVQQIRSSIERGDVYQVNACRTLRNDFQGSLRGLFSSMLEENPADFSSYIRLPGVEVASASPERFLSRTGEVIVTSPIKGTAPLDGEDFGEKDQSENLMIVDLMRNDVSAISVPGSVQVSQLFRTELHPGLKHLVSDVQAQLLPGTTWAEIFQVMSPPGSVSGAPKSSALRIIQDNEGTRDLYCGFIGWVHGDRAELAVTIRTFWRKDGSLSFGTGAGITWGSDPLQEWEETELKAANLIRIARGATLSSKEQQ